MIPNILVGDIGSTKSSWYFSDETVRHFSLPGYNPVTHAADVGVSMLSQLSQSLIGHTPDVIWYYGAGVIELQLADRVRNMIASMWPSSQIHIGTDLEGAARGACRGQAGTVAILGTGSHAAVYDGFHILRQANSLGYLLGDEGGSSDIGKSLVQAYFYNTMPEQIRHNMKEFITGTRTEFLKELYGSPTPNQFLGNIARVAVGMDEHPWIRQLISERFKLFVTRHLVPLDPVGKVHILGSIGCIFAGLIEKELHQHGLKTGEFIKDPSLRLFEMHAQHDFSEK